MDVAALREAEATTASLRRSTDLTSPSGPPPFSNSRLKGYSSRVEGLLDPKMALTSSIALTGSGLMDPFPPHPGSPSLQPLSGHASPEPLGAATRLPPGPLPASSPLRHSHPAHPHLPPASASNRPAGPATAWPPPGSSSTGRAAGPGPGSLGAAGSASASAENLAAALAQIQTLKAEIAGVETVLGYLKGSEATTTVMGRKTHKLPSQEQLRARADALATGRASLASRGGGGGGNSVGALSPLRASVNMGSGAAAAAGGGGGGAGSPVRARSAGDGSGGGGGLYDTLAAETKLGRTWRAPRGPQPVGRGEAVILEAALDEALPPGAITSKYGSAAPGGGAVTLAAAMTDPLAAPLWGGGGGGGAGGGGGGGIRKDFEMLDMVQREVARQVAASCAERGRVIEKLADRHSEVFSALAAAARVASESQRLLGEQLAAVSARAQEQASDIASLRSQIATRGAEAEDLREQLADCSTQHEHHVWDTEQELEQLQGQNEILAAEVEHLHVRLSEAVADKDAALTRGLERLEGELAAVTDERDDLGQRIRFLERQLHKLRTEANAAISTCTAEVQTDPVQWQAEEEDFPDDNSDTPSLAEIRARYAAEGYGALSPEERLRLGLPPHREEAPRESKGSKKKRALGHFQGLISSTKPGRVRGLQWTVNAISAIYYDKLTADAIADREGNPRPRLADFCVDWHMTRFGLRNLAELNLLDLIASVRHHYKASVRVRWFGQFTGLVEVGDTVDTTPHLSFYLFMLQQMAAPNSLVALFPDAGGEEGATPPVAIRAVVMPEAVKAIFKYLGDMDGATNFLLRAVDPLTDPDSQTVPLDPLVALLMAEYQKRWERNAAHLHALFRAGDYDDDGYIGYDEFVAIVRQLLPEGPDRAYTKMYGEAMRRLPDSQSLMDADTFVQIARAFGCDRWRIDAGPPLTPPGTGGGTRPPGTPGSGPPGSPARSTSMAFPGALNSPGSVASLAAALAGPGGPRSGKSGSVASNLRRTESVVGLSDPDRALLRVLDGALEGLDPPLDDQIGQLLDRLRLSAAGAEQRAAAAAAALAAVPGLEASSPRRPDSSAAEDVVMINKLEAMHEHFRNVYDQRTDPAAAWLAFRMLLAALATAAGGGGGGARTRTGTSNARSRPGSAKGQAGWVVPKALSRLTTVGQPFRSGTATSANSTRPGTGGGGGVERSAPSSRGSPLTATALMAAAAAAERPDSVASGGAEASAAERPSSGRLRPHSDAVMPGRVTQLSSMIAGVASSGTGSFTTGGGGGGGGGYGGSGGGGGSSSGGGGAGPMPPITHGGGHSAAGGSRSFSQAHSGNTYVPANTSRRAVAPSLSVGGGAPTSAAAAAAAVAAASGPPPGSPQKRGVVFSLAEASAAASASSAAPSAEVSASAAPLPLLPLPPMDGDLGPAPPSGQASAEASMGEPLGSL
ncbi:hypothetical protein HYH03_018026 [Edaphochlamys debaryana]|uniref:EF-hand domain-containing protein n=1 Tax=Edaphochlamys debaryana TaxID=47281 RepID=A0A836BNB7_9CHLO|nr:hypothetical protein HYH03_018026 [Edaphochlamys debaryana]|eukprot:KAG2483086.1 hypothetical protein HYH03_018026 [Edaphochlamys debaryana]